MQFGIGILGKNWDRELHYQSIRDDERAAHPAFAASAGKFAAKLAADTIHYEPPSYPDLSDNGILEALIGCVRPVRKSEVAKVRDAFLAEYPSCVHEGDPS